MQWCDVVIMSKIQSLRRRFETHSRRFQKKKSGVQRGQQREKLENNKGMNLKALFSWHANACEQTEACSKTYVRMFFGRLSIVLLFWVKGWYEHGCGSHLKKKLINESRRKPQQKKRCENSQLPAGDTEVREEAHGLMQATHKCHKSKQEKRKTTLVLVVQQKNQRW